MSSQSGRRHSVIIVKRKFQSFERYRYFFQYQIFSIQIPILFPVPNFSDTGSKTFSGTKFSQKRVNSWYREFPVPVRHTLIIIIKSNFRPCWDNQRRLRQNRTSYNLKLFDKLNCKFSKIQLHFFTCSVEQPSDILSKVWSYQHWVNQLSEDLWVRVVGLPTRLSLNQYLDFCVNHPIFAKGRGKKRPF